MPIVLPGNFYVLDQKRIAGLDPKNRHHLQLPKTASHARPYYYAYPCSWHEDYFWFVPLTSQQKKYANLMKYHRHLFYAGDFMGERQLYLIQNMLPIRYDQVARAFTKNDLTVHITHRDGKAVNTRVKRVRIY